MKLYRYARLKITRSDFLKVFSGNLIGSGIYALSIPVLSRLFDAVAFGNFQLLFSTVSVFTPIASLKYEKSIILATNKQEQAKSYLLSLVVLIITCAILYLLLLYKGASILSFLHAEQIAQYYHLVVLGVLLEGILAIAAEVAVKEKKIAEFSFNRGLTLTLYGIYPLLLLPISASFSALFAGRLIAYVTSTGYLYWKIKWLRTIKNARLSDLYNWAGQLKDFPAFYVPLILSATVGAEMPVFLFYRYFGAEAVGLYSLTYRVVQLPLSLVQNSIADIYFLRAAETADKPQQLMRLYKKTLVKLAAIVLVPVPFLPFAPYLTELILGPEWTKAGVYIQLLYPFIFFNFLNSSVSSVLTVLRKMHIGLILTVVFLFIRVSAMLFFNQTDKSMLLAFSLSSALFYLVYNFVIYLCIRQAIHEKDSSQPAQ